MKKWLTLTCLVLSTSFSMPLFADYAVKITDPSDQQTFQNDAASISVSVSVTPSLQKTDRIVILIDGQQHGDPEHTSQFSLPALERGSHTLQARVITSQGHLDSETITIFQQRHSALLGPGGRS